ncbi:hypothetical protein GQ600_8748 [Phytophthora cactorum]|nr:hypothetical protein GQ600_8748 [Phytophthora cactorum]
MISPAIHRSLSWRSAPHICGTSLRKTQIRRELRHWREGIMKRVVDVVNEFLDILSGSPRNVVRNNMSNDVENTRCGWKSGIPGRSFLMSLRRRRCGNYESACCWSVPSNAVGPQEGLSVFGILQAASFECIHHTIRFEDTALCYDPGLHNKRKKKSKKAKLAGYTPSLRCVCQPLQGPEDRPRAWSFLSSTASACLENIVNSAWWDVEERVRSDLENATSPTHRLRELLESTRHSIPFKRRVKGKKRKRKRSTGFTKGINEKKRKL